MSEKQDDGGAAFPMPSGPEPRVNATTHYNEGMSLRDWFAAHAPPCDVEAITGTDVKTVAEYLGIDPNEWRYEHCIEAHAKARYQWADAMLKARKQ